MSKLEDEVEKAVIRLTKEIKDRDVKYAQLLAKLESLEAKQAQTIELLNTRMDSVDSALTEVSTKVDNSNKSIMYRGNQNGIKMDRLTKDLRALAKVVDTVLSFVKPK